MKRKSKRFLAWLLSVAWIISLIPCMAVQAYNMGNAGEYQTISAGNEYTAAIKNDGSLWTWGWNSDGQLGDGTYEDRNIPVKIMDDVIAVSAGGRHTAAIKSDGSLWTWGWNSDGQLGDGTFDKRNIPVKIMDDVIAVSAGGGHTAAIKNDGSLWTWGWNKYGQLGDSRFYYCIVPVKVMDDVVAVSAGGSYTAAIKSDGSLWTWGINDYGQLGDGHSIERNIPVKIMDDVAAVSAGSCHTAAIKKDGSLWTWGRNDYRELGDRTSGNFSYTPIKVMDDVVAVSVGCYHTTSTRGGYTVAIKSDSSLWTWGHNGFGQLGDGTNEVRKTPVKVMDDVAVVSAAFGHTAAIKKDGSLWTWGLNRFGQLGDGTSGNRNMSNIPVKIMDDVCLPGGMNSPINTEQTEEKIDFYVPDEMNIGDISYVSVSCKRDIWTSDTIEAEITSSDENVAKLTKNGKSYYISAVGEGTAEITAKYEGTSQTKTVTVKAQIAETISDEAVLKAKICADNHAYKNMRDDFANPASKYAENIEPAYSDLYDGINNLISICNAEYTPKNYYEIILTEMLTNDVMYKSIRDKYDNGQTAGIIESGNSLIKYLDDYAQSVNKPVNQILQVPKDDLADAFDISKYADKLNVKNIKATDAIDVLLTVNDTIDAYNEKYTQLKYLAEVTNEQLSVLNGLMNASVNNDEFKKACKNVASVIVETTNQSMSEMKRKGKAAYAGLDEMANKLGAKAVEVLTDFIPGKAIADAIVNGAKFISNSLFNSDALANDEIMMKAVQYIDNLARSELKTKENNFKKSQTVENAVEFMAYADFNQMLSSYGCDVAAQYMEDYSNAGITVLFGNDKDAKNKIKSINGIKESVRGWDFYNPTGDIEKYLRVVVSTDPSGWAKQYIDQAIKLNILPEDMQNNYQNNITRAEFCKLMTECIQKYTGKNIEDVIKKYGDDSLRPPFDDCLYKYATYMTKLGIVNGVGNNNFNPLGEITRQEAAAMLMRAAKVLGNDTSAPGTDLSGVASWAADSVNFVVNRGIMNGTDNGFEPDGKYTKEQSITTMVRFYENLK